VSISAPSYNPSRKEKREKRKKKKDKRKRVSVEQVGQIIKDIGLIIISPCLLLHCNYMIEGL
jgi:hypothetical protein